MQRTNLGRPAGHLCEVGASLHFTRKRGPHRLPTMIDKRLLDELGARLGEAAQASPAQDLEKNLRALLGAFFDRFDDRLPPELGRALESLSQQVAAARV